MIDNPLQIEISKKEIYTDIWEFSIPEGYYFESCGISYGNHIFGRMKLDNHYIIKKRGNDSNIEKDSI